MNKLNQTQKTFPRSLNECFKSTTDYACSIEGPKRSSIAPYILGVVVAVVSCATLYFSLKG